MGECKPLPTAAAVFPTTAAATFPTAEELPPPPLSAASRRGAVSASVQGLTLVHFSAQHERFVWDRGCA